MPVLTSAEMLQVVIQTGFAGLFVWLLFCTQRDAHEREAKLLLLIEKCTGRLEGITRALTRIETRLSTGHLGPLGAQDEADK